MNQKEKRHKLIPRVPYIWLTNLFLIYGLTGFGINLFIHLFLFAAVNRAFDESVALDGIEARTFALLGSLLGTFTLTLARDLAKFKTSTELHSLSWNLAGIYSFIRSIIHFIAMFFSIISVGFFSCFGIISLIFFLAKKISIYIIFFEYISDNLGFVFFIFLMFSTLVLALIIILADASKKKLLNLFSITKVFWIVLGTSFLGLCLGWFAKIDWLIEI